MPERKSKPTTLDSYVYLIYDRQGAVCEVWSARLAAMNRCRELAGVKPWPGYKVPDVTEETVGASGRTWRWRRVPLCRLPR